MDRRKFFKYLGLASAGYTFTACNPGKNASNLFFSSQPEKLEKDVLTIGLIPVVESAPLIIAKEKGFWEKRGLKVGFSTKKTWKEIEEGLTQGSLDAAIALFAMPMLAQLSRREIPMVSLMTLNVNGHAMTFNKKLWDANLRPIIDYINFQEFTHAWRKYLRTRENPLNLAVESQASIDYYLYSYWLSAMGINPTQEVKISEIFPSQMIYQLQAGSVDSYLVGEPWNQQAVTDYNGFTAFLSRDIWKGHPGNILGTMQPWVEQNPNTAKALVAGILEACKFCDSLDKEGKSQAAQIISQGQYLNKTVSLLSAPLEGNYNYGGFDKQNRQKKVSDFQIFHYKETPYLKQAENANYPWRSDGIWLLTQLIRWNLISEREIPKNADELIDKIYPIKTYEAAAKDIGIKLPSERLKVEPATSFIDAREFNPAEPVAYLNSFDLRVNRPKIFSVS